MVQSGHQTKHQHQQEKKGKHVKKEISSTITGNIKFRNVSSSCTNQTKKEQQFEGSVYNESREKS